MQEKFWATLDALIFRFFGFVIGIGGVVALLSNNRWDLLFGSAYGLSFLIVFVGMGSYCAYLMADNLFGSPNKE